MSFVPLVRNPISDGLPPSGHSYLPGLYVLRIVVRPREEAAEQVYCLLREGFELPVLENNGAPKVLRGFLARKFIKRRFAHYYVGEHEYADEEELAMLRRTYSRFDHEKCVAPERGVPVAERAGQAEQGDAMEGRFKYLTLLVAARANHPLILQRLRAKGIDCEIVPKYEKYKFKACNNSAALFHNIRFDLLLNEVAYKKEFEFNNRFVLTILVTPFIRLLDRNNTNLFPEGDFELLQGWLRAEHPMEALTLWRFEESKGSEFYLQTGSKVSTLFLYYVLNHYGEKCSFKSPKDYERMPDHEKRARMKVHYPRPGAGLAKDSEPARKKDN